MSILLFLLIFGVVVTSHEFGHFLLAKANGIRVVEFSIGMGPKIFSWGKGETKYVIRLLPIGGACMFDGEDGVAAKEGDREDDKSYFPNASVWVRISTVFAGPFFNLILAMVVALVMVQLIIVRDPIASQVREGSAAQTAGLMDGDRIISMNGERIYLFQDLYVFLQINKDKPIDLVYERQGQRFETSIQPVYDETDGQYYLGILCSDVVDVKGLDGIKYAWYEVRSGVNSTYKSLLMMLTGQVGRKDIAGPVGIANVVGEIYEETKEYWLDVFVNMLNITMLLSINLGILNLLPLPALDGGRLLFLLIEVIRRKPIPPEKEGRIHLAGLVFFLILMVLVLFNDISNIIVK